MGLRVEQTKISGKQITTGEGFENNYTNLFPSGSINYSFNENHKAGLSISKRLDRPGYNDLNPFRFFVNTYTFRVGNPLLTPQFTWSSEINYTLKQRYYFTISYGKIMDNLGRAIFGDSEEEVVVIKPVNIKDLNTLGITASIPINFSSKWNSQWNINFSSNDYYGLVGGFVFSRVNRIFVFNTNHDINLRKGFRLQLGGFYLPKHFATVTEVEDISQVSVGLQKSILNNKGSVRLNFRDIFYKQYPTGRTEYGTIDDGFISKRDSRYATFTFSFNFGKQTVQSSRRRQSAVQEELNRARQGNN